jgi:hypothetical protein
MLLCIPALRDITQIQDDTYLENLAAAALILRQFEEIAMGDRHDGRGSEQVNFLSITDAILRSAANESSQVLNAVYWVAVRQETYFSFSVGRAPELVDSTGRERAASLANRMAVLTSDVARWKYGDRPLAEWGT